MGLTNSLNISSQPSASVGDIYAVLVVAGATITLPAAFVSMGSGSLGGLNYLLMRRTLAAGDIGRVVAVQLGSQTDTWCVLTLGTSGSGNFDGVSARVQAAVQSLDANSITPALSGDTVFLLYITKGGRGFTLPDDALPDIQTDGGGAISAVLARLGTLSTAGQATGIKSAIPLDPQSGQPVDTGGVSVMFALPSTRAVYTSALASG